MSIRILLLLLILCSPIGLLAAGEPAFDPQSTPAQSRAGADLAEQLERAIQSGTAFLMEQQQADGTWRSATYGLLKDGTSLTPLVMWSLPDNAATQTARARGLAAIMAWLDRRSDPPQIKSVPQYPVYTAGLTLQVFAKIGQDKTRADVAVWRKDLLAQQLTMQNGWSEQDVRFGGWGYSHERPLKPAGDLPLSPLDEPNLSATLFALEGLSSEVADTLPLANVRQHALRFVERCQNYRDTDNDADQQFNDGGFYFLIADEVRNKPGVAGTDRAGQTRYLSYGSATADGLRLLQLCGVSRRHPRRNAARQWLVQHLDEGQHPGKYPATRQHLQPALDFYYAASLAHVLEQEQAENQLPADLNWSSILAELLIKRQNDNGSWKNQAVDVREDDPLIATSFALRALQICRKEILAGHTAEAN